MNKFHRSKFATFISSRGFYVAVAICLVGAGIATWLAVDRTISGIENQNNQIVQQNAQRTVPPLEEVARPQPGIPIEEDSSPEPAFPAAPRESAPPVQDTARPQPSRESTQPPPSSNAPSSPEASSEPAAAANSPAQPPQQVRLQYSLPVRGDIINPFSDGELVRDVTLGEWRTHNGVDIAAEPGTEVIAAAEGKVVEAMRDERWGGVVSIDHPDGRQTIYKGLSYPLPVRPGEEVSARQVIGVVEGVPIESALGIHLHFELRENGAWINPLSVIASRD